MEWFFVILFTAITFAMGVVFGINGFPLIGFLLIVFSALIIYSYYPVKEFFKKWF
jgi:hypothetical protein